MDIDGTDTSYPLSPLQREVLFHAGSVSGSETDVAQVVCRLPHPVDVGTLEHAWQRAIDRHDVLRTSFRSEDAKEPVQEVHREATLSIDVHDWRRLSHDGRHRAFETLLEVDRCRGFDVGTAPVMRVALCRLGDADHRILWSFHPALLDGLSATLVLKDVSRFHAALARGRELRPSPSPPFRAYIDWLQRQDSVRGEAWWRGLLPPSTSPRGLAPARPPSPPPPGRKRGQKAVRIARPLASAMERLARSSSGGVDLAVQALWALLLARYGHDAEVVFGATRSFRPAGVAGVDSMVGLLLDTSPIRLGVDPRLSFRDVLEELRAQRAAARPFEPTPWTAVRKWIGSADGAPLFASAVAFEDGPIRRLAPPQYPLTLVVRATPLLSLEIVFDRGRFDDASVERMAGHCRRLLEGVAADPGQRIGELPLLSAAEERRLRAWNGTAGGRPRPACVPAAFEAQVARTPAATAVEFEGATLSYAALNERANRLGRHLRARGVGPDVLVGVCLDRSLDLVVALLGILKAGGAYLPLDPAYPRERLRFVLEDTSARVVLTQERLSDVVPAGVATRICLDADADATVIARERPGDLGADVAPDDLAYVVYTSGSTGTPKGVAVSHRAVVRLVRDTDYVPFTAQDRFLQFAPIAFDASTFEIWGALLNGARLVVFPPREPSLAELGAAVRRHQIATLWLTADLFHLMVDHQLEDLTSVRQLLAGGDVLSASRIRKVLARFPACRVVNGYGPTEGTTFTCCYGMQGVGPDGETVPIGRPIARTQVYVLDPQMQRVPVGIEGELYIGGEGVARGYWNRPGLTAERFVPDPFGSAGARLYRTADKVRYREDGNLEFLGRVDHQVKIRGHRVELGEIESVLARHPGVESCVVVASREAGNEKRLVAYVVPRSPPPGETALREFLQAQVPEYLLPGRYVRLEALPRTPTGKVDRRALPAPTAPAPETALEAPCTATEELVARTWADLLGLPAIDRRANFFDLGGHSLLAMQVVARVRELFAVQDALQRLFTHPTLADFAADIDAVGRGLPLPPIEPADRRRPLPLSFAQERLWFLHQFDPASPLYNVSTAWRLAGTLSVPALEEAITEIVRRHEVLRTTVTVVAGDPVQVVGAPSRVGLPLIDLQSVGSPAREQELERVALRQAAARFDLAQGPLVRAALIRLAPEDHVLLVTVHHLVSDGWSRGLWGRELAALYNAFAAGQPSPLAALPIQYADYAVWQRGWLRGAVLQAQLQYWKRQLAAVPERLELPFRRRRSAATDAGAWHGFEIGPDLLHRLRELGRREDVTLFMTLLAALQALLARYTGRTDVVVGTPVANRSRVEMEGLIGFFVNMLVLRTDLSGTPTVRELLARVRNVALGAYAHQDLPFEKVIEDLQPVRDVSRPPLIEVVLALQSAPSAAASWTGLTTRVQPVGTGTAKFDLNLSLTEADDRLLGTVEYKSDLFDRAAIERLLGHYRRVLEAVVADPEQRIDALPLLAVVEERQLRAWNRTTPPAPTTLCLPAAFEAQAARTPAAVAVEHEGITLTYSELNQRANRLAHHLRARGVGPEVPVGLCLDRSLDLVVALLGILKAGGAYVPLDPTHPTERLLFILADARVPLVVTETSLAPRMEGGGLRTVCLDRDREEIDAEPAANLATQVTPDNAAYVIYTSGSTGRPKGVVVTHANVARLMSATAPGFQFSEQDVWTLFHSSAFDFSVWELWGALLYGGRLVIVPYWTARSPAAFHELLRERQVTVLNQTPTAFRELMKVDEAAVPARGLSLRLVIFGGEALDPQTLRPWIERHGDERPRLINMYGITETTVHVTSRRLRRGDLADGVGSVIGRPIPDLQLYIFDDQMRLLPVSVTGELYVGGEGVARGYLNRPDLTAERFVPDPFGGREGSRLYRTGDMGRRLATGEVEYLGRRDAQVKVRGYRVELGEVEAALRQHAAVSDVVVEAPESGGGERSLVAYVVGAGVERPTAASLRRDLQAQLPGYLIPSRFVLLDSLPLTPNGKVDRAALRRLEVGEQTEEGYVAPRTPTEELLAGVWGEILGRERVGIHDNFFELGGHSLLATRVISRASDTWRVPLALRSLFEAPTVAELAQVVERQLSAGLEREAFAQLKQVVRAMSPEQKQQALAQKRASRGGREGPQAPVAADGERVTR